MKIKSTEADTLQVNIYLHLNTLILHVPESSILVMESVKIRLLI